MSCKCVALLASCLLLAACRSPLVEQEEPDPVVCRVPFQRKPVDTKVVGFYPSYKHENLAPSAIDWGRITRVVYAFALPTATGVPDVSGLTRVGELVQHAHARGVEAYVSVGGGGGSSAFPIFAARSAARRRFVVAVRDYLGTHCLDGVDIDWEAWSVDGSGRPIEAEMDDLVSLLSELGDELRPLGLGISIDVYGGHWGGRHYRDAVYPLVDEVQVMAYDFSGPWSLPGPHSSYEQAIGTGNTSASTGLAYWEAYRGWPKSKILLGVPFYGRDFDVNQGEGISWRDILLRYPEAHLTDRVANIYYNSPATIAAKTRYAVDNGYGGIMIWELAQDTQEGEFRLLEAVSPTADATLASATTR